MNTFPLLYDTVKYESADFYKWTKPFSKIVTFYKHSLNNCRAVKLAAINSIIYNYSISHKILYVQVYSVNIDTLIYHNIQYTIIIAQLCGRDE